MHKVLAEIIAGMIPHKMTRNRWRGILRFGLFKAWRTRRQIAREKSAPQHYLTLCAIAKDEGTYLEEWVEWHLAQGVERIYFYDNESKDSTREVLRPYIGRGVVEYIDWPGYRRQLAAYDDCLERHRFDSRWIAFIDIDEFIVPMKDATTVDFLGRMEDFAAVEINWLCYGSGGQRERRPGKVMERFHRHSKPDHRLNRYVKSIVNPRRVYNMIGCHEASVIDGYKADPHGKPVKESFRDRRPQQDVIRINHYAVKSYEEFQDKQKRGRASGRERSVKEAYFQRFDLNDIEEQ